MVHEWQKDVSAVCMATKKGRRRLKDTPCKVNESLFQ